MTIGEVLDLYGKPATRAPSNRPPADRLFSIKALRPYFGPAQGGEHQPGDLRSLCAPPGAEQTPPRARELAHLNAAINFCKR